MAQRATTARRWLTLLGIPVLAWIAVMAWSFSSPVGSSPDDDFHLAAIWCGLGERPGLCEAVDNSPARAVPAPIVHATCYAFHPDRDASCWKPGQPGMAVAERANADGLYPKFFYAAMSIFASPDVQVSVLVMRGVSAAFLIGLLTATFHALPRALRPAQLISVIGTVVPLGLFILGSNNPSSWAIVSAAAVWVTVYGTTLTTGRRRVVLAALAVLATLVGAGARADAAIFAVFGAAVGLWLGVRGVRRQLIALGTGAAILVLSLALYFSAGQSGAAVTGLDPSAPPLNLSAHVANLLNIPLLWTGAFGQWNLGWLDTPLPAVVWFAATAVFTGAIFVGLRGATPRRMTAFIIAGAAAWLVPFVLLAQTNATVGSMVQPRYVLPLLVILLGVASLRSDAERAWDGARYGVAASALTIAVAFSLHQNMRRYTTGLDDPGLDPGQGARWWWAGAPSPMFVWIVGVVAFAGVLTLLWFAKERGALTAGDTAARPAIP